MGHFVSMIMSLMIQNIFILKFSKVMDQIILSYIQITSLIYDIICVHDNVLNDPKYSMIKFFMFTDQIILSYIKLQASFMILFVSMIMSIMIQNIS